jgi:alkaline phosphatase D
MLGKTQKQWWKDTMKGSDATWKLWGNEVTLMRLRITAIPTPPGTPSPLPADLVVTADAWDGYNAERTELMTYLKANAIKNVVVLTGDIHAAFAGQIMDNFEAAAPTPVAVELVGPGIASNSLLSFYFAATTSNAQLNALIAVDATAKGFARFTENFNLLLLGDTVAAATFANPLSPAPPNVNHVANPHLKYADTNSQGYGYIKVGEQKVEAQIITINRPIQPPSATAGPGIKRTAHFTVNADDPTTLADFQVTGTKPFPLT